MGARPFAARLLPAPVGGGFAMDDYWVWCGSAARGEDGRYHLFASRWPRRFPFFRGYLAASEIVRACSDNPAGPYVFESVVCPARGAEYWDGRLTHNPTLHRWGDTWLLFYIGATYPGPLPADDLWRARRGTADAGYSTVRIGLATAPRLTGPWTRRDQPVLDIRPGRWDSTVVTNPAPCVLDDGRIILIYRSNTPAGLRLGAAVAEHFDAPFTRLSAEPILASSQQSYVEDPFLWYEDGCFQLLAKDWTGGFTGEPGAGVHTTSPDALHWAPPVKAYSRRVRWTDGRETVQGALERPQLLLEDGRPTHLYCATSSSPGAFQGQVSDFERYRTWCLVQPLTS